MAETISRDEVKQLIDRGAVTVVEALPEQYFAEQHLPGAVNVPHDAGSDQVEAALPDKSAPVITYCASPTCANSAQLATRLEQMGYTDVREYAEGKSDWVEAGLPTESGAPVRS
jgi:rhodanese-related sulfurtransferase